MNKLNMTHEVDVLSNAGTFNCRKVEPEIKYVIRNWNGPQHELMY